MSENLTQAKAVALQVILTAAERGDRIARAFGDVEDDIETVFGTARSVGDKNGNFDFKSDVRDLYLRVTSRSGLEHFWSVRELIEDVQRGYFAKYDWS